MSGPLSVTIAGRGLAARVFHAPLIEAIPGLRVERMTGSGEDPFDPAPDLLVVATPNDTHTELVLAAIEREIPVVVDKPLASTAAEAERVVAAARERGVPLTVFQNRRWDSDHLTLENLLRDGHLGRVLRFESRFERWRPEAATDGPWRETRTPLQGGGVLLDLGSHLVDEALHLFGPVSQVYAEIASVRGTAADDHAFLALTHVSGTASHLSLSALVAAPGPRMRVLGTEAAFVVARLDSQEEALRAGQRPVNTPAWGQEPQHNWGRLHRGEGSIPVRPEPGAWPAFYLLLERHLRDPGAHPLPVDPIDAVRTLHVIEAARRSAETGAVIALPR